MTWWIPGKPDCFLIAAFDILPARLEGIDSGFFFNRASDRTRGIIVPMSGSEPNSMERRVSYVAFLRNVYFFRDLEDQEIGELALLCEEERYEAGEILFLEGAVADKFYIIMEGRAEVWKSYDDPLRNLLAIHGPGHFIGEMALIDDLPRSATVVARERSRALCMTREDFQHLIRSNGHIALSVMMSISLMLRRSNENYMQDLRDRNMRLETANRDLKAAQESNIRNERLSTIGKFSSLIMHDIRNPLAVIKALSEIMEIHIGNAESLSFDLKRLRGEIERMERLAQEFLDYSRGEIRLSLGVTTIDAVVEELRNAMGEKLERSGVSLVLVNGVSGPVVLDKDRFVRVLVNLSENARKAMPSGGKILVTATREDEWLHLVVADNGEGMSEEVRSRMFEPFYSSSGRGGTGLGMLIVKNIIEAHEGEIDVVSEPDVGTEIHIRLPARL